MTRSPHPSPGGVHPPAPLLHVLLRQDDNGHIAEVGRYASLCEAELRRDALAATGHRQLYWVEVASPSLRDA